MQATPNSGRFIQFQSMAKASKESFGEFLCRVARDHGEIFDFICSNYPLCRDWWEYAKFGDEKI